MSRSLRLLVLCLLAISLATVALAATDTHTLIRLDISTPAGAEFVRLNQGSLDVVMVKPDHYAEIAADRRALDFLDSSGHSYEIIQRDLEASLAYADKGAGFGIYHTWSENIAFVDSLRLLYPQVVSAKWSLGQSLEGRDIWCFRVSANPDVDENEPEILIDGLHHAREIMASEFPIMFAEYLASNYGVDPEITYLLDHRELYIVPVVNPDGFVYNETTNPNGGGFWRKNRRNNGDGTMGVDLNRNYPYQWGLDDVGSSPDPSSEVYRGPGPGSEPATQAMMSFINAHEFRTHDSIHSYSNLTLYPWGYVSTPTPDGAVFDQMAAEMTRLNGYQPGQPGNILYDVNGGAFDWVYGDGTEHTAVYCFTNEIGSGSDGFWPPESRRQALFQENIWPHIYLMRVAGPWVIARTPVILNPAKSVAPGQSAELSFTLENQSVYDSMLGLDLTVKTDDPWLQLGAANRSIAGLPSLGTTDLLSDPLPFSVAADCPNGHQATVMVVLHLADGDLSYPLTFTIGTPSVIVSEDFESGTGNWTLTGNWAATSAEFHSADHSLTDSPGGNYPDQSATSATLSTPVTATTLQFWHRFDLENTFDFGRVQVNAGSGWQTVASYTGSLPTWDFVELGLANFTGQEIQLRFLLETDQSVTADGWYIDDVTVVGVPTEVAPDSPVAMQPVAGASVAGNGLLVVQNSGTSPVYGFRVYSDPECTQLAASVDNIATGSGQTAWQLPGLADGTYYWRAWAGAFGLRSDLSAVETFTISTPSAVGDVALNRFGLRVLDGVTDGRARLQLTLPGQQDVKVEIYDARGARVRRLHTGTLAGGTQVLVWDGRDSGGRAAASGVYLVRISNGREARVGRVVMVR